MDKVYIIKECVDYEHLEIVQVCRTFEIAKKYVDREIEVGEWEQLGCNEWESVVNDRYIQIEEWAVEND